MLGLGNRLNKSRVYKTFVGQAAVYENVLAEGSFGQGGYVISYDIDETSSPAQITYTEVYPSAVIFTDDSSTATALTGAQYINDTLDYVYQEGTDAAVVYDDYRMAYPADVDAWLEHVYPSYQDDYYSSIAGNQYISVSSGFYLGWQGDGFILQVGEGQTSSFFLHETDGSQAVSPSGSQLESGSFYFLAVRTFTESLQIANQTPLPTSNPLPIEPSPLPFELRTSGDLTSNVTSNPDPSSDIDLSVNANYLSLSATDINMYLLGRPPGLSGNNSYDDLFKIQINIEFPVDQATNTLQSLEEPWGENNTEQKKAFVEYVILGWEDFPFIQLPLDLSDPQLFFHLLSGSISSADAIEYGNKLRVAEIDLNKASYLDDVTNAIPVSDGQGGFLDGFYHEANGAGDVGFSYVGYLDVSQESAHYITGLPEHENIPIKDLCNTTSFTGNIESTKRAYLVRIINISFGTDDRPPSEKILFPQEFKYIFLPIILENSYTTYANDPEAFLQDFIDNTFSASSGQNQPPSVGGNNEDYYN